MDLETSTLSVARGDGLVARFGDVVIYVADTASADPLLAALRAVSGTERPGAVVAQRLAALAFGDDSVNVASFGLVAPTADGLLVLLRGDVSAEIEVARGTHKLSGARAFTWVDEIVPGPVRRVAIASGDGGVTGCPHSDLRAGVVPAGGFVLRPAGATEMRPAQTDDVAAGATRSQEPTRRASPPADTAPGAEPSVETSAYVPVAGFLGSQGGAVYPLDRDYVIGRDPLRDDAVRHAMASPIVVHDDQHVSRVHAHVSINGTAVFVRDAATPAGTFIAAPGAEEWSRIGTTPTELEPGWSVRVGEQILTYHTGE